MSSSSKHPLQSIPIKYPIITSEKVRVLLPVRGKRLPPMILPLKLQVKMLPSLNWNAPRIRKGFATQIVSTLPSLTHGTTFTPTFRCCPVITCLRHRAMCGSLFVTMTWRCLGPLWLPRSPMLIYAKTLHSPCLFSSNLGRVPLWVGRSGYMKSCLIQVSWWHYSRPVC